MNAVIFVGTGDETSLIIGTFSGYLNSYYSGAPLSTGEEIPPDLRKFSGVPFGAPNACMCMAVVPGCQRLAAGGKGGLVQLYRVELEKGKACTLHMVCKIMSAGDITTVALDTGHESQLLAMGTDQRVVQLWAVQENVDGGGAVGELDRKRVLSSVAERLQDGTFLFAVRIWQFYCTAQVHSISLTADGELLAVGTSDCTEVYHITRKNNAQQRVATALAADRWSKTRSALQSGDLFKRALELKKAEAEAKKRAERMRLISAVREAIALGKEELEKLLAAGGSLVHHTAQREPDDRGSGAASACRRPPPPGERTALRSAPATKDRSPGSMRRITHAAEAKKLLRRAAFTVVVEPMLVLAPNAHQVRERIRALVGLESAKAVRARGRRLAEPAFVSLAD